MKAVIFNSGVGNRMGEFTQHNHKAMAVLANGETILGRQLRILSDCGIKDFVITTGPYREQIEAVCHQPQFAGLRFTFVQNDRYSETNYIYSMHLARPHLNGDALVLHGDLVFDRKLIEAVLKEPGSLGVVNAQKALPEKDFKARVMDGEVREVSIHIFDKNCQAFQPLYKLTAEALRAWSDRVAAFVAAGNDKVYAENALNEIFDGLHVKAFSYDGYYIDEIDNLDDQARVSADIRTFDWREQQVIAGSGSSGQIGEVLARFGAKKVLLVCDSFFDQLFVSKTVAALPQQVVQYSGFSPNPKYEEITAGVELMRREGCDAVLSIGGGSAIDTAKAIKLFSAMAPGENYLKQKPVYSPVRHLSLPTTAGTGSESTRFSVIYYNGEKQSLTHDTLLPDVVILEPAFLKTLPDYQRKATMADALCQCVEAIWSINANESCRAYGRQGLQVILGHWRRYLAGDETVFGTMMEGSNLSGHAINISQTTAAHAMSYKLSSLYRIAHGHAVALCMVPLWKHMIDWYRSNSGNEHLRRAFAVICEGFGVTEIEQAYGIFCEFFRALDLKLPALDIEPPLNKLVSSVNPDRLKNNPVVLSEADIEGLYRQILA